MQAVALFRRVREKGLRGTVEAIQKRLERRRPEDLLRDPIANKLFALRLSRIRESRERSGLIVAEPDFVSEAVLDRAQDACDALNAGELSSTLVTGAPSVLLGPVADDAAAQWEFVNLTNAFSAMGWQEPRVAFREDFPPIPP